MPLSQYSVNQSRGQVRKIIPHIVQALRIRKIIINTLDPLLPFRPVCFSNVRINDILLPVSSDHTRHSGQPGRVPVLLVKLQTILFTDFVQIVYAFPVFRKVRSINPYNSVQALASGIHQTGHRQFKFPDNRVLLFQIHAVRFHERVPVVRHIRIPYTFTVQRIKTDPRAGIWKHCSKPGRMSGTWLKAISEMMEAGIQRIKEHMTVLPDS